MNFLRWLAITTTYIVIFIIVEYNYNYFYKLFQGDTTFISETIAGIFLLGIGMSLFYSLEENPTLDKLINNLKFVDVYPWLGVLEQYDENNLIWTQNMCLIFHNIYLDTIINYF